MIPDLLGYIFNVDLVELYIKVAMGESIIFEDSDSILYYATHNLHSDKNGRLKEITFSKESEKYIIRQCNYKKAGDAVEYFDNASKALGIIFFKFDNAKQMLDMMDNSEKWINVNLEN